MAVLLDSCALIELSNDTLPAPAHSTLQRAAAAGEAFVSVISALEVAQKAAKGKLALAVTPRLWFPAMVRRHDLRELPISRPIAIGACELPGLFHADPADRLIVATARRFHLMVLTSDQRIIAYAAIGGLTVFGY